MQALAIQIDPTTKDMYPIPGELDTDAIFKGASLADDTP